MRSPTPSSGARLAGLSSVLRDWYAIEQPSLLAQRDCGDVCETRYGGPIRLWLRLESADAWPTRLGGKWAPGHLGLAHSTVPAGLTALLDYTFFTEIAWGGRARTKVWDSKTASGHEGSPVHLSKVG